MFNEFVVTKLPLLCKSGLVKWIFVYFHSPDGASYVQMSPISFADIGGTYDGLRSPWQESFMPYASFSAFLPIQIPFSITPLHSPN